MIGDEIKNKNDLGLKFDKNGYVVFDDESYDFIDEDDKKTNKIGKGVAKMDDIQLQIYKDGKSRLLNILNSSYSGKEAEAAKKIAKHLENDEYDFHQYSTIDSAIETIGVNPIRVEEWSDPSISSAFMEECRLRDLKKVSGEPKKMRTEYAPVNVWTTPNGSEYSEYDDEAEDNWNKRLVYERDDNYGLRNNTMDMYRGRSLSVQSFGISRYSEFYEDEVYEDDNFPKYVMEEDVSTKKEGQNVHIGVEEFANSYEVTVSPIGNVKYYGVEIERQEFDNLDSAKKAYENMLVDWKNNDKQQKFENSIKWNLSDHDLSEFGVEPDAKQISDIEFVKPYTTNVLPFDNVDIDCEYKIASPCGGNVDIALMHVIDESPEKYYRVQVNPITTDGKVCHTDIYPIENKLFRSQEEALDYFNEQVSEWKYNGDSQKFINSAQHLTDKNNNFDLDKIKQLTSQDIVKNDVMSEMSSGEKTYISKPSHGSRGDKAEEGLSDVAPTSGLGGPEDDKGDFGK